MDYRNLGRVGLKVSPLCLGTMNFGPRTPQSEAFSIMDNALEHGINFIDTADVYGGGETEEIIGRWLNQGARKRDKIVLATKVYGGRDPWPNATRLSALHIRAACEASLTRLQTDHIDLYQMHHIDRDTPWDEIWQAMEVLVLQGKIIYVGSSNFAGWHIAQANETAAERNFLGLACEQSLYNLTARSVELEVLPACQAYGMGVIPWSPLAGGILGGVLPIGTGSTASQGSARRTSKDLEDRVRLIRPQLELWEALCHDLGSAPAQVAIAWLLSNPAVTAPIIGPRTLDQLTGVVAALDLSLEPEVLEKLDTIFPGPGGPAPEAYAW
ncbi:MAG: aldo/keto reductase [Actinobacteria bacterium]|nr:aldo/keto reductase [Actinomycetota bacterium]